MEEARRGSIEVVRSRSETCGVRSGATICAAGMSIAASRFVRPRHQIRGRMTKRAYDLAFSFETLERLLTFSSTATNLAVWLNLVC
jgi:hypothetical protein